MAVEVTKCSISQRILIWSGMWLMVATCVVQKATEEENKLSPPFVLVLVTFVLLQLTCMHFIGHQDCYNLPMHQFPVSISINPVPKWGKSITNMWGVIAFLHSALKSIEQEVLFGTLEDQDEQLATFGIPSIIKAAYMEMWKSMSNFSPAPPPESEVATK